MLRNNRFTAFLERCESTVYHQKFTSPSLLHFLLCPAYPESILLEVVNGVDALDPSDLMFLSFATCEGFFVTSSLFPGRFFYRGWDLVRGRH